MRGRKLTIIHGGLVTVMSYPVEKVLRQSSSSWEQAVRCVGATMNWLVQVRTLHGMSVRQMNLKRR